MSNRRDFLKRTSALAFGSVVLTKEMRAAFLQQPPTHAVGLQLYTLFNVMDTPDKVKSALKQVADIGYREVESAFSKLGGFYGMTPKEFAAFTKGLGLSWKSHHVIGAPFKMPAGAKMPNGPDGKPVVSPTMLNLQDNMQQLVDQAAEGGVPYLVCANIPTGTMDEIKTAIKTLNKTGEACKKAGITFAYHNHDMEFKVIEGETPYHLFLKETSAENMKMELDLCWVTKAGVDPVELFKQHPGRFPLWHVKDIDKEMTGPQPVGTGIVDFKRIFANADIAGMKHFFVEHDMPKDPYASITTSYNNLEKILG